jgi:hypothetical protein
LPRASAAAPAVDALAGHAAKRAGGAFQRVAQGRREDDDALTAGVTRPWRSGPVAGQITRLKRLTRQMFGRASLALRERRCVPALGRVQAPSAAQVRPAAALPHASRAGMGRYTRPEGIAGETMRTSVVGALLSVIGLLRIAIGHRRDVARTFAGIIGLMGMAWAGLAVRRGLPGIRG